MVDTLFFILMIIFLLFGLYKREEILKEKHKKELKKYVLRERSYAQNLLISEVINIRSKNPDISSEEFYYLLKQFMEQYNKENKIEDVLFRFEDPIGTLSPYDMYYDI